METPTAGHDASGDVVGLIAGAGIVLTQAAAIIPGLLPVLLLLAPLIVPLVVLGVVAVPLVGIPYGLWRASRWALAAVTSAARPASPGQQPTSAHEVS